MKGDRVPGRRGGGGHASQTRMTPGAGRGPCTLVHDGKQQRLWSEGKGYHLLLAVALDDQQFDDLFCVVRVQPVLWSRGLPDTVDSLKNRTPPLSHSREQHGAA
ncbi:hypothetical protein D1007_38736 [Hordeum vulgare]|nr:hypothetical protein D1007_38736 [Hordeum vulgare]